MSAETIKKNIDLEEINYYIKGIRKNFDTSITGIKLGVNEKKNAILKKCGEIKTELQETTQSNIDHVNKIVEVVLATDPIKKFQEVTSQLTDGMKSAINEGLKALYDRIAKEESDKVMNDLNSVLSEIFFDKEKRKEEFNRLRDKPDLSYEEYKNFIEGAKNKVISKDEWEKILSTGILNWSLGTSKNSHISHRIEILSMLSYYSLQACLRVGIDTGLFLQNIMKFFPQVSSEVLKDFISNFGLSGGLLLTETSSGSDLFTDLQTTYEEYPDGSFQIDGEKHFQGLTNEATHWIVLARQKNGKRVKLFFLDTRKDNVNVEMTERYIMSGLDSITYGINKVTARVGSECVFTPLDNDSMIRSFQSSLFDSRKQFPAMGDGYLERLFDESYYKSVLRPISGGKMIENECVLEKVSYIQAYHSIVAGINQYLKNQNINLKGNNKHLEELSIICKTISTEYMVLSGAKARDLQGGDGFKQDNIVRSMSEDAWPYTRFEGVNEMLYSQLAHKNSKNNFYENLSNTTKEYLKDLKVVEKNSLTKENIGKIYSRVLLINMLCIIEWEDKNSFIVLKEEIEQILVLAKRAPLELNKSRTDLIH